MREQRSLCKWLCSQVWDEANGTLEGYSPYRRLEWYQIWNKWDLRSSLGTGRKQCARNISLWEPNGWRHYGLHETGIPEYVASKSWVARQWYSILHDSVNPYLVYLSHRKNISKKSDCVTRDTNDHRTRRTSVKKAILIHLYSTFPRIEHMFHTLAGYVFSDRCMIYFKLVAFAI